MNGELLSVGLDLGTSTTQMVLSRLRLENRAGAFAVPQVSITDKEVIYRSQVHFTPSCPTPASTPPLSGKSWRKSTARPG